VRWITIETQSNLVHSNLNKSFCWIAWSCNLVSFRNIRFMDISNILIFRIKTIWFIRFRYNDFRLYFMKFFYTTHPLLINLGDCIVYWELGVNNGRNCILILQVHHDITVANIPLSYQLTCETDQWKPIWTIKSTILNSTTKAITIGF